MGSSSKGVVTIGDIEDQRHNPKWFANHKYMLRPNQDNKANKLEFGIFKVPKYWRQPPQDFSPNAWYFGLHNRENLDNNDTEFVKLDIAVQYGLVGEKWVQFCDEIVDDPKAMLACYGLHDGLTNWTDEQVKHVLALDALFLACCMDLNLRGNERLVCMPKAMPIWFNEDHVYHTQFRTLINNMSVDLYRVENQIPLVLIDKVAKYFSNAIASQTSKSYEPFIDDLQYQQRNLAFGVYLTLVPSFIDEGNDTLERIHNQSSVFGKRTHIFGAAYNFICGHGGLNIIQSSLSIPYIRIPSSTKLEQAGINFVGVNGSLCEMAFKKKCLYLPRVHMFVETMFLIRNMVWYESQSIPGGCLFTDYYILMGDLIETPEDWDLLIKYGVILNECGNRGFEKWKTSNELIQLRPSSQTHHKMKEDIMKRFNRRRYRLWSEFNIIFCSKPWLVLSTIAVVLVTLATLVQTYISVVSSNKMKPKFP